MTRKQYFTNPYPLMGKTTSKEIVRQKLIHHSSFRGLAFIETISFLDIMYSHEGEDNLSITELLSSPNYEPVSKMRGSVPHLEVDSNAFLLPENNGISNLKRSLSTARISSTSTAIKSNNEDITFKICPEVKFFNFLLSAIGVPRYGASKFAQYLQVALFHAMWLLNTVKSTTCIFATNDRQDLYGGLVFTCALNIILWWNMNSNRFKLVQLYHSMAPKQSWKIAGVIFACSFALFPPIIRFVIKIVFGNFYNLTKRARSCRNYWIPTDFSYIAPAVFLLDLATAYTNYSVFFITTFVYCYFCFLIIRRFNSSSDQEGSCCFLKNNRRRQLLMRTVREFERTMSFPVLIVLSEIVLGVFTVVSLVSGLSGSSMSLLGFAVSTPQTISWFVLIVFFADRVQSTCLKNIDALFAGVKEPNYFDYKEMKRCCTLTAGSMFVINRKLLLTSAASLITYSVVISELTEDR